MTAPIEELKRAYPDAELHVAVVARWAPLLEGYPGIHRLWRYERHEDRGARAKAVARMALALRREKFDAVFNLHASPSSATIAFATGAKTRAVHFHGHKHKNRYSTVTIPGKGVLKPVIERDMDALRGAGINVPEGCLPRLYVSKPEASEAQEWIAKSHLTSPILGIGLGASRPTKAWPAERYAALAVQWCQEQKGSVIAISGPEDEPRLHEFLKSLDDLLTATIAEPEERARIRSQIVPQQSLPLRTLAALLQQLSVFVGNDSGPKHMAVAVGTPTVTLFGPEHPFEWHPYPRDVHPYLFIENLPCRKDAQPGMPPWCGVPQCIEEQHRCMRMLGVDEVLKLSREISARPRG